MLADPLLTGRYGKLQISDDSTLEETHENMPEQWLKRDLSKEKCLFCIFLNRSPFNILDAQCKLFLMDKENDLLLFGN